MQQATTRQDDETISRYVYGPVIGDECLRVHGEDVGVPDPDPGHRQVPQVGHRALQVGGAAQLGCGDRRRIKIDKLFTLSPLPLTLLELSRNDGSIGEECSLRGELVCSVLVTVTAQSRRSNTHIFLALDS